jgi:type I restriction enzyme S subunit
LTGGTPKTSITEYWEPKIIPWMSSGEVNKRRITKTDNLISEKGLNNSSARWVKEKSVLIALAGQGKTRGTVAINNIPLTTNQSIAAIVPEKVLHYEFIFQNLIKRYDELRMISSGDGTRGGLNKQIISEVIIPFPDKIEQIKIGNLFCSIDDTITLHQRKLDKLKLLKQGYLHQLFPKNDEEVHSIRFAYFENKWEQRKLGDLLTKNSKKNKDLNVTNVESVSNKTGFTKQTEQFEDYSVASADLSNYYVITEKQFAYNPSRINVGSIAYKAVGDDKSVVSPLYVSFSTKKLLNDGYLWNWFKTTSFQSQRKRLSEGGVRDTLSFNQLSEMLINVPEYLEQEKIGSFFKQMDDAIALYQLKLDKLKSIKQSLLQKMFI